jgi:pimeloyl-ACP methyl ester carboxylesterase
VNAPATDPLLARARRVVAPFVDLYPYEHRFLEVPGGSLHYLEEGPRTKSTILAVHGNPTWSFAWRGLVDTFRSTQRVVALDHLGMGLSSRPARPVRLAEHIENLVALVDALGLEDVTLVCHDWGGAIGFGAALARRQVFSRFLVLNTAAFPSGRMPKRIALCRIPLLGALAVRGLNGFVWPATRMTTVKPLAARVRAAYLAPYDSWAARRQVHTFVRDIPMQVSHPSWSTLCGIADHLQDLRGLPMTLVWGDRDWCFDPVFRAGWEHRFPAAKVHALADAGHFVFEDAPEVVARALQELAAAPLFGTGERARSRRWEDR